MKSDFPTNDRIREYLLGKLAGQSDLEKRLDEQIFFDNELSEIVDSIEDEIIENYLDGTVTASDREKIEKYFLRPAERREKLRLSLLLRSRFAANDTLTKKKLYSPSEPAPSVTGKSAFPRAWHGVFQLRNVLEAAALLLLIIPSFVYVSQFRSRLQGQLEETHKVQAQLEAQLALERERSANLIKQVQEARPPVSVLTFLGPTFRAGKHIPIIDIRPWTERVKVELDLGNAPAGDYDVRLQTGTGKMVWSQPRVTASSGGLSFEMPAQVLSAGAYCLSVSPRPKSYCFSVRMIR